ncbi:hypothetical protein [Spirosoma spitsbergense]|uniref:hypothetical protein n=1 Tax=Spirosoma spitsbergense TaxID=431554 RepID=UPI00036D82D3|nr:hypothetical protein [Spirosoma spitsbergense]
MNRILNIFALLASGLAVGWMMGMSVSPVIQTALNSLLVVLVGVLGLLAGTQSLFTADDDISHRRWLSYLNEVNLLPVGVFLFFLAFGSAVGVFTRTNAILGPSPKWLASHWNLDSAQQSRLNQHLVAATFGLPDNVGIVTASVPAWQQGILFSTSVREFCLRTQTLHDAELQDELKRHIGLLRDAKPIRAVDEQLAAWENELKDTPVEDQLQHIRTALCTVTTGSR